MESFGERRGPALAAGAALLFYLWAGVAPSLAWGDGAILARNVARLVLVPSAHGHPLYVLAARAFSTVSPGDLPHRLALLSAASAAGAVGLAFLAGARLTGSLFAAGIGAAALAVSHTFWFHASTAEVYAFLALLEAIFLWAGLEHLATGAPGRRRVAAFAAGAALATHPLGAALLPPLALLAAVRFDGARPRLVRPAGREAAVLAGLVLLGASPYLFLAARAAASGAGLALLGAAAAGGPFLGALSFSPSSLLLALARAKVLLLAQFPSPALALAAAGALAWVTGGRWFLAFTGLLVLSTLLLAAPLGVKDQFAFLLPAYVPVAVWIAAGAARFASAPFPSEIAGIFARRALAASVVLAPIVCYAVAPAVLRGSSLAERLDLLRPIGPFAGAPTLRALPGRDDLVHYLGPPKGDATARPFATRVLEAAAPGAWVLADWAVLAPCVYLQEVEGLRPDVTVVEAPPAAQAPAAARAAAAGRPVYLTSLEPGVFDIDGLGRLFEIEGDSPPWRLRPRGLATDRAAP